MDRLEELEARAASLEATVAYLKQLVALKRVAIDYRQAAIRPGDFFVSSGMAGQLHSFDSDGDWNYSLNGRTWSGRGPIDPERLFTLPEVEAIVAEALSSL